MGASGSIDWALPQPCQGFTTYAFVRTWRSAIPLDQRGPRCEICRRCFTRSTTRTPLRQNDARRFIYTAAGVGLYAIFDPLLGDEPFAAWLTSVLSKHRGGPGRTASVVVSVLQRTVQPKPARDRSPRRFVHWCISGVKDEIGQIWFPHRGDSRDRQRRGMGERLAAAIRRAGRSCEIGSGESPALHVAVAARHRSRVAARTGDMAITPDDIVITPGAPKPGARAAVTVTVRNQGQGDLHKAVVYVAFGSSLTARGPSRQFVVDIPAQSSVEIRLDAVFPQGFGVVMAEGRQVGEHAPHDTWNPDPTPENACAFVIVTRAPPRPATPSWSGT